jgi:dethiobiotin synthetase
MMRGLFVTGTDTGVGKTIVCAALMHRYRQFFALRYWKPVQTGVEEEDDTATVRKLGKCADSEVLDQGVRLKHPLSPHLAAQLEGETIELARVCRIPSGHSKEFCWIVEGAGGALVPISDSSLMINLMEMLELPMVVVARTELGTINHSLLTIQALRSLELQIAGVVLVGQTRPGTREAIEQHGKVTVVGEMPHFVELTAGGLGAWACANLDPNDRLTDFIQLGQAKHAC